MVVGFEDSVGEGFVGIAVVIYDDVVFKHCKFVSHKLQIGIHFAQIAFTTYQQILIALNDVAPLLIHSSQHVQRTIH